MRGTAVWPVLVAEDHAHSVQRKQCEKQFGACENDQRRQDREVYQRKRDRYPERDRAGTSGDGPLESTRNGGGPAMGGSRHAIVCRVAVLYSVDSPQAICVEIVVSSRSPAESSST